METRITRMLHIHYPILQGGLAYLALAELAAAVSNAGGLGQITATSLASVDDLRREITRARMLTDQPFGVNLAISQHHEVDSMVDVVVEEAVPVVTLTGGNPAKVLERLQSCNIKKLVMVSSAMQAKKAETLGADAVIAVGQEGGGHIGRDDTGTFVLIPSVVDAVKIPVVASGGIADGRGLAAALALGAEAIEMGTRFIVTKECTAHMAYKERLLQARAAETRVIKRSIGAPGRVMNGPWVEHVLQKEREAASEQELYALLQGKRNLRVIIDGDFDQGYGWAGQSVELIHAIMTVEDLIAEVIHDALSVQKRLQTVLAVKDK